MINKNTVTLLINRGFRYIGCNQPDIGIFFKIINPTDTDICILADFTRGHIYSAPHLNLILNEFEKKLFLSGYRNIKSHFIIFTDNVNRDKILNESGLKFWLVDTVLNRVLIYENQPDDFYDIKTPLEQIVNTPEKNTAVKKFYPWATISIIAVNIMVFIFMEIFGSTQDTLFMAEHGAMSWRYLFENGEFYRLITSMFMHFGSEHLLNNMITLSVVGNEVEHLIGHVNFLIIYFFSGLGAGFMSALYNMHVNPDKYIISAGASGAIFGIMGALLVVSVICRNVRRRLKPANIAIIAVLSIINGFMNFEIDNMAHIGGLMFGIIITFICCLCRKSVLK